MARHVSTQPQHLNDSKTTFPMALVSINSDRIEHMIPKKPCPSTDNTHSCVFFFFFVWFVAQKKLSGSRMAIIHHATGRGYNHVCHAPTLQYVSPEPSNWA
jgi:hypothetical protein